MTDFESTVMGFAASLFEMNDNEDANLIIEIWTDRLLKAAEIAREEVIKKAVEWLKENTDHYTDSAFLIDESFYDDFKEYMEESI